MPPKFRTPLKVHPHLVGELRAIQRGSVGNDAAREKLGRLLQAALQLEFATIAPYLSAAFSLGTDNEEISKLILRVAREEMLHMTVVANLMNAVGIAPDIVGAVPTYPLDVEVLDPPLHLELRSFSLELVENLFMQIETPEEPTSFPVGWRPTPADAAQDLPETIGQFYQDIIAIIEADAIPDLFEFAARDAYKQVAVAPNFRKVRYVDNQNEQEYPLPDDIDFVITDRDSAVRHLTWLVVQGEGAAPYDPLTAEGLPGHYYRFESILKGRYLVRDTGVLEEFSFSGGDLPFTTAAVHDFEPNAKVENFASYARTGRAMNRFNRNYSDMIDLLEEAFNCESADQAPEAKAAYDDAIGAMRRMPTRASAIIRAAEREGVRAGVPFQYKP